MTETYSDHLERVHLRREILGHTLAARFPEPIDLTLEIGSGHGHWLVAYAGRFPQKCCVGIDLIGNRVERANRKQKRANSENVFFLKAEAMELLDLLPEHVRLKEVFVLFPDPWPKKRHWKNRVFCKRFLEELGDRCRDGIRCHFRTDHREYFEWALEIVEQQQTWRVDSVAIWPFELETIFQARANSYDSLVLVKRERDSLNKE